MENPSLINIFFIIVLVLCAALVVAVVIWLATTVFYDVKSKRLEWNNPEEYARREAIKQSLQRGTEAKE
jgi:hypothetical protein